VALTCYCGKFLQPVYYPTLRLIIWECEDKHPHSRFIAMRDIDPDEVEEKLFGLTLGQMGD
jgi:hypothetical protein